MGVSVPLIFEGAAADTTATVATDVVTEGAIASAGAAATDVAGFTALDSAATAAGSGVATGAATGAATATGGSLLSQFGTSLATGAGTAVASSLLNPRQKPQDPTVTPVVGMPDPLAKQEAMKQSMIEQMARHGRASTVLTDNSGSGKLGG